MQQITMKQHILATQKQSEYTILINMWPNMILPEQ